MALRSTVMVGREPELGRLRRCIAAAPAVVTVTGEMGAGRSRFVDEALELPELGGHQKLIGRCHPRREPVPLGVLSDALSQVRSPGNAGTTYLAAAAWRPHVPELARLLPPPVSADQPSEAALLDGLVEVLEHLGPAILVLEDLQWCDPVTLRLLPRLVARQPATTVLVVTRRSGGAGSPSLARIAARAHPTTSVEWLAMTPLDAAGVREMAGALCEHAVPAELATTIWTRTGGLPRVIDALMHQLSPSPQPPGSSGTEPAQVISSIEAPRLLSDEVLYGAAALDEAVQRVIGAASVLGSPHDAAVIAAVARLPERTAIRAVRTAVDEGLLVTFGSQHGFRAPLTARAVCQSIPGPERRRLHELAARALMAKRPRRWAELARHHRGCGEIAEWARCVDAATVSVSDPMAAVELLRDVVLQPGITPARRARLASRLGSASERAGIPGAARVLLQKVVDEHPLPGVLRADVRWLLGYLHLAVGDAGGWRDQRVAAIDDLRRRPDLAALVMMELAMPWVEHGQIDEHRRWLDRAVAAAARQSDPAVTLCVGVATALVPLYTGDPAGWVAMDTIPWDATSSKERLQLLWAAQNLAGACFHLGYYDLARRLYDRGARLASELDRGDFVHVFPAADLSLAWATGRWDGLEATASEYIQEYADLPGWTLHGKLALGHLLLARGELHQAEGLLRDAASAAHVAGAIPSAAAAAGGLARVLLARGDPGTAHAVAAEAVELLAGKGIWAWVAPVAPPAIEALIATDRLAMATGLVRRFAEGLHGRDAPHAQAALAECEGMVAAADGNHARAAAALGGAVRSYQSLPRPHDAAVAMSRRGISLMDLSDPRGPETLRSALAVFERLGASADAGRVRRALRKRSVVVPQPWRGGRSGYGSSVSPRQQAVVELAASGRTNEEIGRELFISEKTVEDYLRLAMEKLGVSSKRDLQRARPATR